MEPSSGTCDAQEARQSELAASTNLPLVKDAAKKAARAWSKQGEAARAREVREVARLNRAKLAQAIKRSEPGGAAG